MNEDGAVAVASTIPMRRARIRQRAATVTRRMILITVFLCLPMVAAAQDFSDSVMLRNAQPLEQFGRVLAAGDFDGDGLDEVAVGAPMGTLQSDLPMSGQVTLYFGGRRPTTSFWQGRVPGFPGVPDEFPEAIDLFGSALAFGDFNADGFDDLAVGIPNESFANIGGAGAVQIFYGNSEGRLSFRVALHYMWGVPWDPGAQAGARYGHALAVGDFNGDGYDDLAVGAPGLDVGNAIDAGAVEVLYGASQGLDGNPWAEWARGQPWSQSGSGIAGIAEAHDQFGYSLASGDFNGDGVDDLVIGVPYEDLTGGPDAGVVHVLYGNGHGLAATGSQLWSQDSSGVAGSAEPFDMFGLAVAGGDLNGDGFDDLVAGAPGQDLWQGGVFDGPDAGGVHIMRGSADGVVPDGSVFWGDQNFAVRGGDKAGSALAFGDFNGDGIEDLVVGVPGDDVSVSTGSGWVSRANAGSVRLVWGEVQPYTFTRSYQYLHQNDGAGFNDDTDLAEAGDGFGSAVVAGRFGGPDSASDLAVGIPLEDSPAPDAGAIQIAWGRIW